MSRLSKIFEEDIENQDALEDITDLFTDDEDIIIGAMEDRYDAMKESEIHLFTNEASSPIDKDGLTPEEHEAINAALLANLDASDIAMLDDDGEDDIDDDLDI